MEEGEDKRPRVIKCDKKNYYTEKKRNDVKISVCVSEITETRTLQRREKEVKISVCVS